MVEYNYKLKKEARPEGCVFFGRRLSVVGHQENLNKAAAFEGRFCFVRKGKEAGSSTVKIIRKADDLLCSE